MGKRRVQVLLEADLLDRFEEEKRRTGCTLTSFVRLAMEERLKRMELPQVSAAASSPGASA